MLFRSKQKMEKKVTIGDFKKYQKRVEMYKNIAILIMESTSCAIFDLGKGRTLKVQYKEYNK